MAIQKGGRELSRAEQKKLVLKWTGWTPKQYEKEYDKLRNRVRNFEKAGKATTKPIDVADLLAREARSKYYAEYYGKQYEESPLYKAIQAAPSTSTGARGLSQAARQRVSDAREKLTEAEFGGFIKNSKYAAEIAEQVRIAKEKGYYSGAYYYSLVRTYADKLDQERKLIAAFNKDMPDRAGVIFFES